MESTVRHTPLYQAHLDAGARMVDFAGWDMPVLYTSILDEARSVRNAVGIFDISHMGRTWIAGQGATALLQSLTSNDVNLLKPSRAQYSLLTNPRGGIIDDIIVYRESAETYLIVINASNTDKDLNWIREHNPAAVPIENRTESTGMIAVQGPRARDLVVRLSGNSALLALKRFQFTRSDIGEIPATICRTGYTGEDGFELIVAADQATDLWNKLVTGGATPCGLGARDALRIEAGYPLYGHEIDDDASPVDAGLMWVVTLDKGEFTGRDAIRRRKEDGPVRRLVGLVSADRIVPRQGYTVYAGSDPIGEVTSGIFSPTRNHSVAMAYIAPDYATPGATVEIAIRDKRSLASVVPKKALLEPRNE